MARDIPIAGLGAVAVGVVVLVVLAAIGWYAMLVPIPEGHVGVHTERGAATGQVFEPGWSYHNPATQGYETIETRPNTVTMNGEESIYVITEDGQDVWVDVTVRYRVPPEKATTFFKEYRSHSQAIDRLVDPTLRSDMRDEGSNIGAREIITKDGRQALEDTATEALEANFEGSGLQLEDVQVRGVELNDEFSNQLEQVEVENTKAEQKRIAAEGDAEAEIERAEGDAEANRIREESLTEAVLMDKYLDQISDSDKVILATDGDGTPVILNTEGEGSNSVEVDDGPEVNESD